VTVSAAALRKHSLIQLVTVGGRMPKVSSACLMISGGSFDFFLGGWLPFLFIVTEFFWGYS